MGAAIGVLIAVSVGGVSVAVLVNVAVSVLVGVIVNVLVGVTVTSTSTDVLVAVGAGWPTTTIRRAGPWPLSDRRTMIPSKASTIRSRAFTNPSSSLLDPVIV